MAQENQPTKVTNTTEPKGSQAQAAAKPEAPKVKQFLVKEDREIPQGGGTYLLRKGKTISSDGYDIPFLKRFGVKLEELPA